MYSPENPEIINFYKQPPQMIAGETTAGNAENSSSPAAGENTVKFFAAPVKKRAEIWAKEETQSLINFRREIDSLFNTSKSNKHLWDQISLKMREKGFDRSASMCTDKWRNLLKEFKKANSKMLFYKEIEEIISNRNKDGLHSTSKVDSFMQFSDKGIEDTGVTFGPVEANDRGALNLERQLDQDGHPLAITGADTVAASGVSPWNWRETRVNGEQSNTYGGRVITVKFRNYTRRISIDGSPEAIIDAIKGVFRLRSNRAFWLEDEDKVVWAIDRDMPLVNYTLCVDEGVTIKVCVFEEPNQMPVHTVDVTFYSEYDFRDFLARQGWTFLRECNDYRTADTMAELCPGAVYRGVR